MSPSRTTTTQHGYITASTRLSTAEFININITTKPTTKVTLIDAFETVTRSFDSECNKKFDIRKQLNKIIKTASVSLISFSSANRNKNQKVAQNQTLFGEHNGQTLYSNNEISINIHHPLLQQHAPPGEKYSIYSTISYLQHYCYRVLSVHHNLLESEKSFRRLSLSRMRNAPLSLSGCSSIFSASMRFILPKYHLQPSCTTLTATIRLRTSRTCTNTKSNNGPLVSR